MDNATLIEHESGVGRSVSEIPLVASLCRGPSSLSSACSSPPREPAASNPSGTSAGAGNAAPASTGLLVGSAPPATAAPTTTEDVSKLDLAIMACTICLVVPVTLNIKDLTRVWEAEWRGLYGVLMIVSLVSTVTGFFTAWCPAVSWGRRLSPICARLGLVDAAALFIVFLACKLGRFGCAAGVASAALVVLALAVVWVWSERPTTGRAGAAVIQVAGLPHDVP